MRKYLDMEDATLDIKLTDLIDYQVLLDNNIDFILTQNFKRIIFHIEADKIEKLYHLLKKYFIDKEMLIMIYSNLKEDVTLDLLDNFIIVNTNQLNIIVNQNVYNLIELTNENMDMIIESISNDYNVIVEPIIDVKNISEFIHKLNKLFLQLDDKYINLNGFLIPSSLMREHPCNAYLCNGWKCGKKISGLPKYIFIDNQFNLYPHNLLFDKLFMGNIKDKSLNMVLEDYIISDAYKNFQEYNKRVFIKYLSNYPYEYMPLVEYIRWEAENDK